MSNKTTAIFIRKRFQDSGKDQAPDYNVYEFADVIDSNGIELGNKWIKKTKLMKAVAFQRGKRYEITLSDRRDLVNSINLTFPKEISWYNERVYIKGGNSIITVSADKQQKNLSALFSSITGVSNYEKAAFNKLTKGLMKEALLLNMNARGIFYVIHFYDPQDKRKSSGCNIGYSTVNKKN